MPIFLRLLGKYAIWFKRGAICDMYSSISVQMLPEYACLKTDERVRVKEHMQQLQGSFPVKEKGEVVL